MNNRRYYYDDPLAASWMQERHGVKFVHKSGVDICALRYVPLLATFKSRLYVRPDTEYLFDSRDGDWIESGNYIVMRNGLPFHSPKIEEISDD